MSRLNRWPDQGRCDTAGNYRGRYQSRHHHQSHHDRPWSRRSNNARHTWNSLNSSWNLEQLQCESSDINNSYTRQQTDGPSYYDQHYGRDSWPFSHREEGSHEPYFMMSQQQSSSAYAPVCDYIVPVTAPSLHTSSTSQIRETPSIDPDTPNLNSSSQPKVDMQTSPLPEYLEITLESSTHLFDPMSRRKLLILDLNGTLLFRGRPHRSGKNSQFYSHHHHHQQHYSSDRGESHFDTNLDPTALRHLRPVHPRPFLSSFRQYLFHPKTRLWLETMIWSSAQPHSVSDMVQRCFGDHKDELIAVWARDTLGLTQQQYHTKTQTTKDLEKVWTFLSSPRSLEEQKNPLSAQTIHSAHSTLLLDDSPLKAHLQPWNHICVKEYIAELRSSDVEAAQTMGKANDASTYRVTDEDVNAWGVANQSKTDDVVGAEETISKDDSRKRKKQLKKIAKKEEKMMLKRQKMCGENSIIEWRSSDDSTSEQWWRMFDCTLLAVIGVLDAIKRESNVAAWIRKGGLWMTEEEESDDADSKEETNDSARRLTSPLETEEKDDGGTRKPRVSAENSQGVTSDPIIATREELWFEDEPTVSYWIERGIRSLEELDIELEAGVKVS